MANSAPVAESWKKLIEQLPCVLFSEVKLSDSGIAQEIHVLAGSGRSPKQISRDVQSALAARFGVDIDHKIISVAQIPVDSKTVISCARVRFRGLDISLHDGDCSVSVSLESEGVQYKGEATSDLVRGNRYRAIAAATVNALNEMLGGEATITAKDTTTTEICGLSVVLCAVVFKAKGVSQTLVGSCIEDDTDGMAVVKAHLDAINRRLKFI